MSDKRVNVSKGLLDNLSNSVQALTGTAENMSIQEMSNAVSAKINEKFKLIEQFTITKDVAVVERTEEPDGTPYKFKKLFAEIQFTDRTVLDNKYILGALRSNVQINGGTVYRVSPYVTNCTINTTEVVSASQTYLHNIYYSANNGLLRSHLNIVYTGSLVGESGAVGGNMMMCDKVDNPVITGFKLYYTYPIPASVVPVISIYGVRA